MNFYVIASNEKDLENKIKGRKSIENVKLILDIVDPFIYRKILDYMTEGISAVPLFPEISREYENASNGDWKVGELYVEHPRRNKLLIPKKDYKDYILREMVGDIANYIMDNISVSQLVIGIVSSSKANAGASVSVEEIAIDAKIKCSLVKTNIFNFENSSIAVTPRDYTWIDLFPDVKSAVEHKNTRFEKVEATTLDLGLNANIAQKIGASLGFEKKTLFYIYYNV